MPLRLPRRFRMLTLLVVSAVVVVAAGGTRVWYDAVVAPRRADEAAMAAPEMAEVAVRWSGPSSWWRGGWRIDRLWFDEAEAFDAAAVQIGEFSAVESAFVLARQIMPHAEAAARGERDEVIEAWRRHPALRRVEVDASVRGAPLGDVVELYDQDDRALLERVLPDVEVVWMEVH